MSSKLETWLAKLSDPKGPSNRWSPPPFAPGEYGLLPKLAVAAGNHNIRPAVAANLSRLLRAEPQAIIAGTGEKAQLAREAVLAEAGHLRLIDLGRSVLLDDIAGSILAEIARRELAATLVKGADFARAAYGGLHLRAFSDIDLLVSREAQKPVGCVLGEMGFSELPPRKMRFERTERQWTRRDRHGNVILVEVHTDMVHDPILRKRLTLTYDAYADPGAGGITPAARLVLAAIHGAASHLFGRLQYVVDGLMIVRMGVDADELVMRATRAGAILPLATMLRLCAQIYGSEESRKLLDAVAPVPWDRLQQGLITPPMVLAAKGANRWRLLPQRYVYRRLLRTGGFAAANA